jgi:hypothetical protein
VSDVSDRPPRPQYDESTPCLTAEWVLEHAIDIPWESLTDAQVEMASGQLLWVRRVTIRPWPNGPLLELVDPQDLQKKPRLFNLKGFQSGCIKTVYAAPGKKSAIEGCRLEAEQNSSARHIAEEHARVKTELARRTRRRQAVHEKNVQLERETERHKLRERIEDLERQLENRRIEVAIQAAKTARTARRDAIKNQIESRSIDQLCHFTRIRNLPFILQYGLLSRSRIAQTGRPVICNDPERFDRRLDRISLSVTFPNYRLFYRYQKNDCHVPQGDRWVVMLISPEICWTHDSLFCRTNAASTTISRLPDDALSTPDAFESLFDDQQGNMGRQDRQLPPNLTWDPQAEVLVKDVIMPENIMYMAFQDHASCDAAFALFDGNAGPPRSGIGFRVDKSMFKPRHDYEYWRSACAEEVKGRTLGSCPW